MRIKEQYLEPLLTLHNPKKEILSVLSGNSVKRAYNIKKKSTVNDVDTLSFNIAYEDANQLLNYNSCEMVVKFNGTEEYIIKNIKLSDQNKRVLDISCESVFTVLKGIKCQPLNLIGQSPEQLFNAIIGSPKNVNLVGKYKFLGTDIVNTFRAVQTEDEVSVFENLITLCKKFQAVMQFSIDNNGQKGIYIRKNPINKGKVIKKRTGLKSLDIELDTTSMFTRMYGHGANDLITGNPITFIDINPSGKAYVENFDWFLAQGMTREEILNNEQCLQETDYTDNNITTKEELLRLTKEELAKVAIPKLTGTVSMSDFSVTEESSLTEPETYEEILYIDEDIDFIIKCRIESIERKYNENPMDIQVTISNLIKYDSIVKDLVRSSEATTGTTGVTEGGKPFVPASKVEVLEDNGDHVNVVKKLGNHYTLITQNANEIKLTAEEVEKNKAEIIVQSDRITSTVTRLGQAESQITQNANSITSRVNNLETNTNSQIEQLDDSISTKVSKGNEFSTEMKQNWEAFQFLFSDGTNGKTEITSSGLKITSGGIKIVDDNGDTVMWFESDGIARIKIGSINDLNIHETGEDSMFFSTLANMTISCDELKTNRLTVNPEDFYMEIDGDGGYNLEDYVDKRLEHHGLI